MHNIVICEAQIMVDFRAFINNYLNNIYIEVLIIISAQITGCVIYYKVFTN